LCNECPDSKQSRSTGLPRILNKPEQEQNIEVLVLEIGVPASPAFGLNTYYYIVYY